MGIFSRPLEGMMATRLRADTSVSAEQLIGTTASAALLAALITATACSTNFATGLDNANEASGGSTDIWYLGHSGFAVMTADHFLIFDYQEGRDGIQGKVRPDQPSLASGWINPEEIEDSKVRVFVSHSHADHYDPVIFEWKETIPDISYYFGWKVEDVEDEATHHYLVDPRARLRSGALEISTINSSHAGVPEVAWLVKVDGLVIYHNGDCRPEDSASAYDFLRKEADNIDLAFVFPAYDDGLKYTLQNRNFFDRFQVRAVFPTHAAGGDYRYTEFRRVFQERIDGLPVHVPLRMGQRFRYSDLRVQE